MTVVGTNFLFIHVPKCAGKSVTQLLGGATRGVPGHAPRFHFFDGPHDGKFSFGFVRHPWDRMVSSYTFICTKPPRRRDDAEQRRQAIEMGFRRWLLEGSFYLGHDGLWNTDGRLPPYQRRSQMFWLEGCDHIGRTDSIADDMRVILGRVTLPNRWRDRLLPRRGVPQKNTSAHGNYRDYYDDQTQAFIATHFAPEIARFGFRF